MDRLHTAFATLLAIALAAASARSPAAESWGSYDFSYAVSGDVRVRPVQVFDDGRDTFFQFRVGEPMPAIFADTEGGPVLLLAVIDGAYVKVPSTPRTFVLRRGGAESRVRATQAPRATSPAAAPAPARVPASSAPLAVAQDERASPTQTRIGAYLPQDTGTPDAGTGGASPPHKPASPALAVAPPSRLLAARQPIQGLPAELFLRLPPRATLERDSYSIPIRGDLVDWTEASERVREHALTFPADGSRLSPAAARTVKAAVQAAGSTTRFEVLGHDDSGLKEKVAQGRVAAVTAALLAAGAARGSVQSRISAETRQVGAGQWLGATLRVIDAPASRATGQLPGSAQAVDLSYVAQRLNSGAISAAEAVALLQRAHQASAVVPRLSAVPPVWQVRRSDETVEKMLQRWTREAGWRLVWQSAPAVPVTGEAQISRPDIVQAVDYVISQVRAAGHQIQATAYLGNRTLVVQGE